MNDYSYAGEGQGTTDPEETFCMDVMGDEVNIDGYDDDAELKVIMWSGEEYSKDHTWIAATDDSTINLEAAR